MNRERWKRLERLFEEASEMGAARRKEYLRDSCADDPDLAREIESMIRLEQEGDSWIITPMSQTAADLSAFSPGQRIGSYELLREIGRGGMGIVYQARRADQAYDRIVAIKIVGMGPAAVALAERFRIERRILAALDHPHIARLLDGGATESGSPYLVMDYVEGERIDSYCRRHELAIDEVLELFRLVCDAVEYAHRRLIVHRDLKPANILVTKDGTPKLLDFGIAKLLQPGEDADRHTLTLLSGPAFTPDYASPEQVRGEPVSTATDVYSMGAILYELLTGKRLRRIESFERAHIERMVLQTPIPPPSSVAPAEVRARLAGDLDTIILKALAGDPAHRYGSAEQLAEDLSLHQRGLAIKAHPPTLGYRARKFIRRRAVPIAATVSVIVILISLTVFYTVRLSTERRQAQVEAEKANRVSSFLRRIFEMSDPGRERGARVTARELLDLAATELETELPDQPEITVEMTSLIGDLYTKLGLYDRAEPLLIRALEKRKEIFGEESLPVAESLHLLGRLNLLAEKRAEALPPLRRALEIREQILGPDHVKVSDNLIDLAGALIGVDHEEGRAAVDRAIGILEEIPEAGERKADAIEARATMVWHDGDVDAALEGFTRSREVLEAELGPGHWRVGQAVGNIGLCHLVSGRNMEALPLLEESIAVLERSLGPDHTKVAWALNPLATLYKRENRLEDAERIYGRMKRIYEKALGLEANGVGVALGNLAGLHIQQERLEEAEEAARRALAVFEAGGHPGNIAWGLENLARVYRARGKEAEAVPHLKRALTLREEITGPLHPRLAGSLRALADIYMQLDRRSEAKAPLEKLVVILEENEPDGPPLEAARRDLAVIAAWDGDCARAVELISDTALDEMEEADREALEACL